MIANQARVRDISITLSVRDPSVIAIHTRVGNITESSVVVRLAQSHREFTTIKTTAVRITDLLNFVNKKQGTQVFATIGIQPSEVSHTVSLAKAF